ncbi:MAG: mannose-6-phosphate isomerase, class I [Anaerococcus prevotii]|uniref:mannose-6-phosphate isomerase, class I n=1 Tax=Anaerococcus prevotii TaxID=33034 RepID=UPI00290475F5|nr:mannose-6-phosphate isomerase, class I [Anaerococcus prevotii]MDU2557867.1 mannose-6-phosphate isomerase, class I [Anaerococcus prevotii]
MEKILFLEGKFREKIWGGKRLREIYSYDIPSDKTGEYWAISDMGDMSSVITNGEFKGKSLEEVYQKHKDLFGNPKEATFPLLVKIIDANTDLSIQVHPDDVMAKELEDSRGKTECWYILNEDPASIIYGLKVADKKEAIRLIDERKWDELLREVPARKGDFFFVEAGTVHAIKKGSLILEIQQASDITYRLYDYDRKDDDGKLRDLHLEESKKAIKINKNKERIEEFEREGLKGRILTRNKYFEVYEYKIEGISEFEKEKPYLLYSVVDGSGEIIIDDKSYDIGKGDFFILTNDVKKFDFKGDISLVEASTVSE